MALTNDFKVKNGLTVIDSISAGGNLSASEGFFDGDVGIGTNNPTGKLEIKASTCAGTIKFKQPDGSAPFVGSSVGTAMVFQTYNGVDEAAIYVDNSNNFTIGGANIHLDGVASGDRFKALTSGSLTAPSIQLDDTSGDESGLYLPATNQIGVITDRLERLRIDSSGNVGIGTTSPGKTLDITGEIRTSGRATFNEYVNTSLVFGTTDLTLGYAGGTSGIFIKGNTALAGNVGIGTTAPQEKFHIHNSTGNSATIRLSDPDSTSTANATGYVEVYHGENTSRAGYFGLITNSEMALATTTSAGNIKLYTGNNTAALTIDSSQRVGIGDTTPSYKLDVNGDINTQSDLLSGGVNIDTLFAKSAGNITGVTAGDGLSGGGSTGDVTVCVDSTVVRTTGNQTITGNKTFSDSAQLRLGTGNDLRLYHATDSYISNEGSGHLYIQNFSDDKDIIFKSDNGTGGVGEYFRLDGSQSDSGSDYRYTRWQDYSVVALGSNNDLQLFHTGTNSYISNYIGDLLISNNNDDGDIIFRSDNGSGGVTEYFRLDGDSATNIFSKDVLLTDNISLKIGSSADLKLLHDSTDSIISNGTGDLHIINSADDKDVVISSDNGAGGTTTYFRADGSTGSASMAHYGTTKLQTSSTGITVCGDSLVTGDSTIYGNLSVTGDFTCLETTISTTSALSVTNTGTGPALFVCQAGVQPIAHFIDANGDDIVFADDGKVGIGTFNPAEELTVSGTISASEFVYVGEKKAVSSDDINFIVKVTQAEYDALTPDSGTLYIITDENTNSPVINPITTVTANYTVTDEDHTILTNGSSVLNVGLPSAVTNSNYVYNVKNVSTNAITISAAAGNIDGQSSQAICQQFENITVQSDGSNWFII